MKIEEYECVKIKRRAQARIYEQTKDLTPEELVAHYQRIGTAASKLSCAPVRRRRTNPLGKLGRSKSDPDRKSVV